MNKGRTLMCTDKDVHPCHFVKQSHPYWSYYNTASYPLRAGIMVGGELAGSWCGWGERVARTARETPTEAGGDALGVFPLAEQWDSSGIPPPSHARPSQWSAKSIKLALRMGCWSHTCPSATYVGKGNNIYNLELLSSLYCRCMHDELLLPRSMTLFSSRVWLSSVSSCMHVTVDLIGTYLGAGNNL